MQMQKFGKEKIHQKIAKKSLKILDGNFFFHGKVF